MRSQQRFGYLWLSKPTRSPYSLVKNAIKKARERQEDKELLSVLKSYRKKCDEFLYFTNAAFPKIKDCKGDYRHEKDFTVKPTPRGTFETPLRCQPKRWRVPLPPIGENEDNLPPLSFGDSIQLAQVFKSCTQSSIISFKSGSQEPDIVSA